MSLLLRLGVATLCSALIGCSTPPSQPPRDACGNNLMWGVPKRSDQIYCRNTFAFGFNNKAKLPEWVMYHLRAEDLDGKYSAMDAFKPDDQIPPEYQATYADYDGTGYDRAHLAPPALVGSTLESAQDAFRMSNVVPQHPELHRRGWVALQQLIRYYTAKYGDAYVVSGISGYKTLFTMPGSGDQRYLTEASKVRVPLRFYTAVYVPRLRAGFGFLLPNEPLRAAEIFDYSLTITELERRADVDIFPRMAGPLLSKVQSSRITPRQGIAIAREQGKVRQYPDRPHNPFYVDLPEER